MNLSFSIVINTYNRAKLLNDAILGLSELDYPNFEIIIVNGPSIDYTQQILDNWKDKVKVGYCSLPNLSMSRNIGIEMGSGDVIAFIDDDAIPHPSWLTQLSHHYLNPIVGGVGGFTIDNTGLTYQVCKTVCDRFGNAYYPSDFFDERALTFSGSPYYPSLLGTNSSFRKSALCDIKGFDHTFAYFLDETDVCIRLIDCGYKIVYEPNAIVYHQFAESHIRNNNRIPKSLYYSAVSKSYFIGRHGIPFSKNKATEELDRYEKEILTSNKWLVENGEITQEHRVSLDDDVLYGIKDGTKCALEILNSNKGLKGDLNDKKKSDLFLPMVKKGGLSIAFISRSFPPLQEAGIARWTWMMATGLAERGHKVHVITLASSTPYSRYLNGIWIHAIEEDHTENGVRHAVLKGIPSGLAPWCCAVESQVKRLKNFGLEVISFPIWDVEGMGIVGDDSIGVVMSLHTSYLMAKPFKPDWLDRPLFEHFHIKRVVAAETKMLKDVPYLLANSNAIIEDLTKHYSVDIVARTLMVPHGTIDPFKSESGIKNDLYIQKSEYRSKFIVTYVGRFEKRKGFDIACSVISQILVDISNIEVLFVGDIIRNDAIQVIRETNSEIILKDDRVKYLGVVNRQELDEIYINSDVVLMPSRYESFGLVAIEALAAGTPVIALAAGGLKEVIDNGITGFLVQEDGSEVNTIVDHLRQLSSDNNYLYSMKCSARQSYINNYTVNKMVEEAEKIYYKASIMGV